MIRGPVHVINEVVYEYIYIEYSKVQTHDIAGAYSLLVPTSNERYALIVLLSFVFVWCCG